MSLKLALAQMDIAWHDRGGQPCLGPVRLATKARDCGGAGDRPAGDVLHRLFHGGPM